jgi:ribose transport system permease protein
MLEPAAGDPPAALKGARIVGGSRFKILGIFLLLLAVSLATGAFSPSFLGEGNVENLLYRTALFSILGIGVAFVIITGGIDLSIGSVVALIGCMLPMLIAISYRPIDQALLLEVYQNDPKGAVLGDVTQTIRAGDTVFVSAEKGKTVLGVKAVQYKPNYLYEAAGVERPATVIEFAAPVPFGDTAGIVSKTFRVLRVEPAGEGSKALLVENPSPMPKPKDLLKVIRRDGTLPMELPITAVSRETGEGGVSFARVVVRDRNNAVTGDYAYATPRPHEQVMSIPAAIVFLLALSVAIGLAHGLLITRLKLQPFVVTLCGLLIYRGVIRFITNEQSQGFGANPEYESLRYLSTGSPFAVPIPFLSWLSARSTAAPLWSWIDVPMSFIIMVAIAVVAAVFLNYTIYGRYLLALGRNEQAARYSGISTDRMTVLAYVICSLLAGFGGLLFILNDNQGQPSNYGNFYELYAIAAAVLGGCSLRGGEGSILGVVVGAAVMQVLRNSINLLPWIGTTLEFAVIGAVILIGVVADELVKRVAARRRAARQAARAC